MDVVKLLIDGSHLLNRVFYTPQSKLSNSKNEPIGVVHGFLNSLASLYKKYDGICKFYITWDKGVSTFRRIVYSDYKHWKDTPTLEDRLKLDVLSFSKEKLDSILGAISIPTIALEGYEADDLIGYLADELKGEKIIISEDKDLLQLLTKDGNVKMFRPISQQMFDIPALIKKFNLHPKHPIEHYIFIKSIIGDGEVPKVVDGLGEKNANRIARTIIDGSYTALQESNAKDKAFLDNKKAFERNLALVSIMTVVNKFRNEIRQIDTVLENTSQGTPNIKEAKRVMDELELWQAKKHIDLLANTVTYRSV